MFSLSSQTWLISSGASWSSHLAVTLLVAAKLRAPAFASVSWSLIFAPWWVCAVVQVFFRVKALQHTVRRNRFAATRL